MKNEKTRLFFVVDGYDMESDGRSNNEIFETLEEAQEFAVTIPKPSIYICKVRNAYRESDGQGNWNWNYEDFSDTFDFIKEIK